MDMNDNKIPGKFERFNIKLAYYLNNVFKFIFALFKFCAKTAALIIITFPFILFGMCIVSPAAAIKTLEVVAQFAQIIINLFKQIQ
jgi:ABC-type transport system involved in cytochrome bd biosynthesis fused ATPase/permease subunit